MIYHNLIPCNINIKKGLIIKLTDLSNVYNEAVFSSPKFQSLSK
jgi:hypothetical protein